MFDRAFTWPALGLLFGERPVRTGDSGVESHPGHGWAIGGIEIRTPAGDAGAQVGAVRDGRVVGCLHHGALLSAGVRKNDRLDAVVELG